MLYHLFSDHLIHQKDYLHSMSLPRMKNYFELEKKKIEPKNK